MCREASAAVSASSASLSALRAARSRSSSSSRLARATRSARRSATAVAASLRAVSASAPAAARAARSASRSVRRSASWRRASASSVRAWRRSAAAARPAAAASRVGKRVLGRPDALVRGVRAKRPPPRPRSRLGDLRLGRGQRLGDLRLSRGPRLGDPRRGREPSPRLGGLEPPPPRAAPRRPRPRPQLAPRPPPSPHSARLGQLRAEVLELRPSRRRARPRRVGAAPRAARSSSAAASSSRPAKSRRASSRSAAAATACSRARARLGLELPRALARRGELGLLRRPLRAQRRRSRLARLEHPQPHGVARARHLRRPHPQLQVARPAPGRRRRRQRVGQRRALVLVARRALLQLRGPRGQRVALGDQRLDARLELRAAQLQRVERPQRLRRDPRLRLLGRLGPPRAALRHHRAVDDLAARLLRLLGDHRQHRQRRRALVEPRRHRQRRALAALPLEPHARARDRLGQQVGAAPHAPVAAAPARRVGQRLVARHPAAHRRAQHRQPLGPRRPGRPPPAHAHEPGVSPGRQPFDRLEREAVEDRGRRGFRHRARWSQTLRRVPAGAPNRLETRQRQSESRLASTRPTTSPAAHDRAGEHRGGEVGRPVLAAQDDLGAVPDQDAEKLVEHARDPTRRRPRAHAAPSATAATRSR